MKLRILSDLHLEYKANAYCYTSIGEDIVILAGDTISGYMHETLEQLLKAITVPVILIAGNHDFYNIDVETQLNYFSRLHAKYPHVHFLHNTSVVLDNVRFIGTPLWTDFDLYGQSKPAMSVAENNIRDFSSILYRGAFITPKTYQTWFNDAYTFISNEVQDALTYNQTPVVITHWVPSPRLISDVFLGDPCNPYFTSRCDALFGPHLPLWIHGHSHDYLDINLDGTRHIRNPKGYPKERNGFIPDLVVSV